MIKNSLFFTAAVLLLAGQPVSANLPEKGQSGKEDLSDSIMTNAGNSSFEIIFQDTSAKVRPGNKRLEELESLESAKPDSAKPVVILNQGQVTDNDKHYETWEYHEYQNEDDHKPSRHFRGHWSSIEFGFSNWVNGSSMILPDEISYMTLYTTKSNCYNLNPGQVDIGFSRYTGLVTGIGINWNNYRFEGESTIRVADDGIIREYIPDSGRLVKKSKFNTIYVNVPILFEVQIPAGYDGRLYLAAGVIGGIRISSWTRLVYEDGEKTKANGNYNLNLFRGGVTARMGYRNFALFGTYYLSDWFQDTRGPNGYNLEPFEIGMALTFND